jgi:hypothetical protein
MARRPKVERLILARSPRFQALLAKSRQSIADGKGLSSKEFWKAVAKRQRKKAGGRHRRPATI